MAADEAGAIHWSRSLQQVWKTWLLTRLLTLGAAAVLAAAAGERITQTWKQWDAGWFLDIAEHGYGTEQQAPAFYPLYPFLLRLGGELLDDRTALAGFLLSLALTLAAFVLLHALASRHVDQPSALRAVMYLALFPYAFFLQAFYSETAFLVVALGACLAAERERFLAAGMLTGAAMLTRPVGPAVLVAVVVLGLRSTAPRAALTRLTIAPAMFVLFPVVLVLEGRSPLAFLHAEDEWRDVSPLSAFLGISRGAKQAWIGLRELSPFTPGNDAVAVVTLGAFLALVAFTVLSVVAWRRLGAPYGLYCTLSLAVPVVATTSPWPLASMQRFVLTLFPCFIVLGSLPIGRTGHRILLTLSGAAMVGVLYYWTRGEFVA